MTSKKHWTSLWLLWLIFGFTISQPALAQDESREVLVLTMDGPVTAAMAEYLKRGIRAAEENDAEALILQLNTPGGELNLMLDMVEAMRASRVPVVVYVSPAGALAASAGTLITLAGHAAAMAPETAIGAASPVGGQGEDLGETYETKLKETLKATVRALTERRPPEAVDLAQETIESAKAVSASEALQLGLVDFIARDIDDLLGQLDGHTVDTIKGPVTLETGEAQIVPLALRPIEQLLQVLTDPNIVFLLLTIGVQAILIELGSPGGWVAGFIGVVALTLAVYGLGLIPVNWFGIIFLIISFVLFVLDIKAPTHGALTAAGVASFIVGALVLFNSPRTPDFQRVSVPLVVISSLVIAGTFFLVLTFARRAQMSPILTGQESLVGRFGTVRGEMARSGKVQVGGELWSAELADGEDPIPPGSRVEVVSVKGVTLQVRRAERSSQ